MSNKHQNGSLVIISLFAIIFLTQCRLEPASNDHLPSYDKVNGVSFVAPRKPYEQDPFTDIKNINANWVAIMPYSFCDPVNPEILYDLPWQWWGEQTAGIIEQIDHAQGQGLDVLLKPHVWVKGQGWNGDFICYDENSWQQWEQSYEAYILHYARLAANKQVPMFCVGLEYKRTINARQDFWVTLIRKVRAIYDGKVIYAANWDNYQNVPFWDDLDFICVNAYFPLMQADTPTKEQLMQAFGEDYAALKTFAADHNKQVIFTEYGYRSVDGAAGNQWELPDNHRNYSGPANLEVQKNAYEALYHIFWDEGWFAGGFLWKWYADNTRGGDDNTDYTPQNKPVIETIKHWYGKHQKEP